MTKGGNLMQFKHFIDTQGNLVRHPGKKPTQKNVIDS